MNDPTSTLLDRLDQAPVAPAPIGELLAAGRATKRRRRRVLIGSAAAATALVLGGGVAVQSLATGNEGTVSPADGAPAAESLTVRITNDPATFPGRSTSGPVSSAVQAAWDPDAHTLTYLSNQGYSGSCPPNGIATITPDGAVELILVNTAASPGLVCTSDAQRVAAVMKNVPVVPTTLSVSDGGVAREVPFVVLDLTTTLPAGSTSGSTSDLLGSPVSQSELDKAETVAREAIADHGAIVTDASVIARTGTTEESNTGRPCTSGRELQIRLIGTFPHTVTTGHPIKPGTSTPDVTVRAMNITADADTGLVCLISVQTGEDGAVEPLPGSTTLPVS